MTGRPTRPLRAIDFAIALWLTVTYAIVLVKSVANLGYARDEGFYFQASTTYERWFELLLHDRAQAMQRRVVDAAWTANHEHPSLIKSLFAFSHMFLQGRFHLFAMEGTSFRFPAMVLSSLGLALVYLWGAEARGRVAGAAAAIALAAMPRFFFQSHLACFDSSVATVWAFAAYAFWKSQRHEGLRWKILAGVAFGLALDTKHNSWFLPFAAIGFSLVMVLGPRLLKVAGHDTQARARRAGAGLLAMATIGPCLFYALWPWIWHDTVPRLIEWAKFHLEHEYYNMEFLGETYWRPPMPRGYAWLMTAATVPAVTLVLFLTGLAVRARVFVKELRAKRNPFDATDVMWMIGLLINYVAWLSPKTPIFGGTKHWMTAYPFLALFAGVGFDAVVRAARSTIARLRRDSAFARRLASARAATIVALAAPIAAAPIVETWHAHPWGLSAYTPLVGGASGAANLGLNRSFWGYTTGVAAPFLNEAPRNATVHIHDTAMQSWDMLQRDGRVRRDLRASWTIAGVDVAIYHHEQHMAGQEYQDWIAFGSDRPRWVGGFDGVPVIWIYER